MSPARPQGGMATVLLRPAEDHFRNLLKPTVLRGWGTCCFLETELAILDSVKSLVLSSRKGSFLLSPLLLLWTADIIVSYLGQEGGVEKAQSYGTPLLLSCTLRHLEPLPFSGEACPTGSRAPGSTSFLFRQSKGFIPS